MGLGERVPSTTSIDENVLASGTRRRPSRFEVTPVTPTSAVKFTLSPPTPRSGSPPPSATPEERASQSPKTPSKSILKRTVSFTYSQSPHSTLSHGNVCAVTSVCAYLRTRVSAAVFFCYSDSRLRQAFETIFLKSLKLQDANNKVTHAVRAHSMRAHNVV